MSDDLLASEDRLAFEEVGQNVAGFLKNGPPEPQAFVAAVPNEERRVRDGFDSMSISRQTTKHTMSKHKPLIREAMDVLQQPPFLRFLRFAGVQSLHIYSELVWAIR
jgi:hypothetical protein